MAEREIRAVPGDDCRKINAGQTGNKTVEHAKIARDIYNKAKTQVENKKK